MTDRLYKWVCHTCEVDGVDDELAVVQSQFNEHAERGCEVVLRSVSATRDGSRLVGGASDTSAGNVPHTDE
jgi:hypothetical protein